jgi:hypothetical protein
VPIQEVGKTVVLEALVLHDVAPVARRVAHRQKNGFVLLARTGERLITPGIPVNRVVFVLEEIGTCFGG